MPEQQVTPSEWSDVLQRLARIEERGISRDAAIQEIRASLEAIGNDVRDAKTGLKVGFWIGKTLVAAVAGLGGWLAHGLFPGK